MEALLIIAGAVLLLGSWLWLLLRTLRLGVGRFLLALFAAPLTLLARRMGYPLWPRLFLLMGMVSLLTGTALLYQQHPERWDLLLSGRWAAPAPVDGKLQGTITGQAFAPERAYWRGHDLVFEEGPAQRVRRSLVIRFGSAPELLGATNFERLPGDTGAWPELLLQWYSGALNTPGLRRLGNGYSMSLDFFEPVDELVQGHIYLQLPATYGTWLAGDFELASAPDWLLQPGATLQPPASAVSVTEVSQPARDSVVTGWQEVSLLALLDEPELFAGSDMRLTTSTGRRHQGVFKQLSEGKRLVLALPQGPDQVELHFQPVDILLLEARSLR